MTYSKKPNRSAERLKSDDSRRDTSLTSMDSADAAKMWQRALMLLIPTDGSKPSKMLLAQMLRSGHEPPSYVLPLLAALLDPEGTDLDYQLVLQPIPKTSRQLRCGYTVLLHVYEVAAQRKRDVPMTQAVQNVAISAATNETKIWESLRAFKKTFPQEYRDLALSAQKKPKRN